MTSQLYAPAGFFLLRAPVLTISAYRELTETSGDDLDATRAVMRDRLRALAADARVMQAIHVASPSTATAVARLGAQPGRKDKRAGRAYSTLLRYLIRMTTRPTPYGLFAGVGIGGWADHTTIALAADPVRRTRTRADSGWLLGVIKGLEDGESARVLSTTLNPLLYRSGDRAILPFADVHGTQDNRLVDFRVTAPVEIAMRMAGAGGVTIPEIVERIAEEVPGATEQRAQALLDQLWKLHVLVSDVRPTPTSPLPEVDLLKRLASTDVPGAVRQQLAQVRRLADRVDESGGRAPIADLQSLADEQRAMTPTFEGATYQVDTALAVADGGLHHGVGAAAAEAADLLLRTGSLRSRPRHIEDYHTAFLERYGVDAEIPLLEVLSPETGLDAPATYTAPAPAVPLPSRSEQDDTRRDAALAALVVHAQQTGADRLELTDEMLRRITVWDPVSGPQPRPSLDLYAQLVAESTEAVDRGDWQLVVGAAGVVDGGRTFGRFFDLFDEADVDALRTFARREEELNPDVVYAELSYLPPYGRGGNVTAHPRLRRREIVVNTAASVPPEDQIALGDILVGATGERFYLRWAATGQELRVTQSHMLVGTSAPNVCRLLLELSDDGFTPLPMWNWGVMSAAPRLPRVTRGRIVLAPAQWLLSVESLGLSATAVLPDKNTFYRMVQEWRAAWRVPRHVYLTFLDNRLLLDLENPLMVDELHAELRGTRRGDRHGRLLVQEALPGPEHAWLPTVEGEWYLAEIVVPLLAREPVRRPSPVTTPPAATLPATAPRRRLVGEEWVHLKLYAGVSRHDDIITETFPALVADLRAAGLLDRWYFLRYGDPHTHLRLRLRAPSADVVGPLLLAAVDRARELVRVGHANDLVVASYDREVERYGGPAAIEHVEKLFEASSAMVVDFLTARRSGLLDLEPDLLAIVALHALDRAWSPGAVPPPTGTPDVPDAARTRFRQTQKLLCDLLEPWPRHRHPDGERLALVIDEILSRSAPVVTATAERLRALGAEKQLVGTPRRIFASVAHMQMNRLLGMDNEQERRCHEILALALAAIQRRPVDG